MTALRHGYKHYMVRFFYDGVADAHKRRIMERVGLEDDDVFAALVPIVRDALKRLDSRLMLTPVYDRPGWWTVAPGQRVATLALRRSYDRAVAEQARNARVFAGFPEVGTVAAMKAAQDESWFASFLAHNPLPPGADPCLRRIDEAEAAGLLEVAA